MMRTRRRETFVTHGIQRLLPVMGLVAFAVVSLSPARSLAQPVGDAADGWLAWLGCWEPVAASGETAATCLRPADGSVELLTLEESRVTSSRLLPAGGGAHPVTRQGCEGTERIAFSGDGHRIFLSSRLSCGDIERSTKRLWAMVSPGEWVEVRSVQVEGRMAASVTRHRPADASRLEAAGLPEIASHRSMAVESARLAASSPVTVDDLIEAHDAVGTEVVEAWLAEQGEPLERLDSERLLRMAAADVPERVIDVAVAVSYPDRFRVERRPYGEASGRRGPGYAMPWGTVGTWGRYGIWSLRYPLYRRGYFYDPYRYGHWNYGGPCVVVVRSANSESGRRGRVIAGQGYVRDRSDRARGARSGDAMGGASRDLPASSRGATGRKAKPRGSGSSGSDSGSGSGSGSGGSSTP